MGPDSNTAARRHTWFYPLLLVILLLIPFAYAASSGQGDNLAGKIKDASCAKGLTTTAVILISETALLALAVGFSWTRRKPRKWLWEALSSQGALFTSLMVLVVIPFIIAWRTNSSVCSRGKSFFWQSIFIEAFILAALAISYNLIFGFAGVISFGHAAFFGIGAYSVGLLMLHLDWNLGPAVLAALLVSALMGILVSVIALRIRGLYFAIFTLTFAEIFYILAQNRVLSEITGAEDGFTFSVPDWINAAKNRLGFYYLALLFLIFCYLLVRQVVNSPTGRVMRAMRENEDRALMLGYNTFIYKTLAIVLAGVLASGAGVLRGLLNKGASPNVLGIGFTMDPLLMTLVGGAGTFSGPVIGAFLLRLVEQALRDTVVTIGLLQVNIGERWFLILGILFIASVIAFPAGIVGSVQGWWARWRARRGGKPPPQN